MLTDAQLTWLLVIAMVEILLVELYVLWVRVRAARRVGTPIPAEFSRHRPQIICVLALWLGAAAFWVPGLASNELDHSFLFPASMLLFLGALIRMLAPRAEHRALGPHGVVSGWTSARFESFAEWRLVGDHLRFRLEGQLWDAVEVPASQREPLREQLEQLAPERQSRYAE